MGASSTVSADSNEEKPGYVVVIQNSMTNAPDQ